MRTDCFNYDTCRKPVECCVKGSDCFWERKIVDSKEDEGIKTLHYVTLECGHKSAYKGDVKEMQFCTSCCKF